MSSQQQQPEHQALSGLKALFGGYSNFGRNMQAIAGEFAKMSEENIEAGVKAADRLREAHSLQELTDIQSDLMKESYVTTTNHYRRIAELAASTPQHLAHSAEEIANTFAQFSRESAERVSELAQKAGGQAEKGQEKAKEDAQAAFHRG